MAERCVCCGEIIPEGRQVCHKCENVPLREKLVEIYKELEEAGLMVTAGKADAADLLIAKGVTVPQWVPVTERLPDKPGYYLTWWHGHSCPEGMIDVLNFDGTVFPWTTLWKAVKNEVTHWMPLPEPPKGE